MLARMRAEDYREALEGRGLSQQNIEDELLVYSYFAEQADAAGKDPKAFFEFVVKHETTGADLKCEPHQRVIFDFVMAHRLCVVRLPAGTSKTFSMGTLTMYLLGQDPTGRGAIVSSTQGQAMKPLAMVRDTIESSQRLRMVFPKLRKSLRKTDEWTQTEITVDRPPAIRDASLVAVGIDGAIAGARLSWIVVDDILDRENTASAAGLQKVHEWFDSTVLSRIDPGTGRIVVTNTPWHPEDLTYRLEEAGWPTLTMDVEGNITLSNCPDWDSPDITPSARPGEVYRLATHNEPKDVQGQVCQETVPLWPQRYSWDDIAELRKNHLLHRFNQLYMCVCRSDETAKCKVEWVETCKAAGRGQTLVSMYAGGGLTITGVDLAVGKGSQYDNTAFFTFEQLEDGHRRILDVEFGQWDAPTIVDKLILKHRSYKSLVMVENNAAQDYLRQFVLKKNASIPIKAHTTGRGKSHPEYGVEGIFLEMMNGAWIIPSSGSGQVHPAVEKWISECLYYNPDGHPGDVLMASWLAVELARQMGFGGQKGVLQGVLQKRPVLSGALLAR